MNVLFELFVSILKPRIIIGIFNNLSTSVGNESESGLTSYIRHSENVCFLQRLFCCSCCCFFDTFIPSKDQTWFGCSRHCKNDQKRIAHHQTQQLRHFHRFKMISSLFDYFKNSKNTYKWMRRLTHIGHNNNDTSKFNVNFYNISLCVVISNMLSALRKTVCSGSIYALINESNNDRDIKGMFG